MHVLFCISFQINLIKLKKECFSMHNCISFMEHIQKYMHHYCIQDYETKVPNILDVNIYIIPCSIIRFYAKNRAQFSCICMIANQTFASFSNNTCIDRKRPYKSNKKCLRVYKWRLEINRFVFLEYMYC